MGYNRFRIRGYKGINKDIVIDLEKTSLIPLIGINECGKTTILEAIFSFDRFNDSTNNGRHLDNIENMYSTIDNEIKIEAKTEFDYEEFVDVLNDIEIKINDKLKEKLSATNRAEYGERLETLKSYRTKFYELNESVFDILELFIGRNLKDKKYYFLDEKSFPNKELITKLFMKQCAYCLISYTLMILEID